MDIAQAAGFTKGAVYTHFGSKEQMFLASVRSVVQRLRGEDGAGSMQVAEPDLDAIATLGVEALLFGRRVPEHRAEARELMAELIPALSRAAAADADADPATRDARASAGRARVRAPGYARSSRGIGEA